MARTWTGLKRVYALKAILMLVGGILYSVGSLLIILAGHMAMAGY